MTNNFSEHLFEERKRLGFSQEDFGALGGVGKIAQYRYETGERVPDVKYIDGIQAAGADVLFLFTGNRTPQTAASLSEHEAALIDSYRKATDDGKAFIRQAAGMTLPPPKSKSRIKKEKPQAAVKQAASGSGSTIQIGGSVKQSTVSTE